MKILCVDDFKTIHYIVKNTLDVLDVETLFATNGDLALKTLENEEEGAVSLILLDWNMPGMSGLELLKILKTDDRWKSIPVIMLTSEGNPDYFKQAIDAGAVSYITKPFAQEDLVTKVMNCLKNKIDFSS